MQAVSIGPLIFAGDRLAAIIGIGLFLIITAILALRVDARFGRWSSAVLLAGLGAARLGHVVEHAANFAAEPWRIVAVWQGGFSWLWAVPAVLLVCALSIRTLRFGLWAAFALGFSVFIWNMMDQLINTANAMPLPTAALRRLDDGRMTRLQTHGKPTVINLWASWCPPCRREMPMLTKVAAASRNVTFLFVNEGEGSDKVRAFLASAKLAPANVLLDPGHAVAKHYGTLGLPVTLFIGADGRLRADQVGEISLESVQDNLARLRARRPGIPMGR